MIKLRVVVLSDTGFGIGGGVPLACTMYSKLNTTYLGNEVISISLPTDLPRVGFARAVGKIPIIRGLHNATFNKIIEDLNKRLGVELVHANILDPRYAYFLSNATKKLNLPLVITVHTWEYLCPTSYNVMLPRMIPCNKSSLNRHCIGCSISLGRLRKDPVEKTVVGTTQLLYTSYAFRTLMNRSDCVISPSKLFATKLYEKLNIVSYHVPNPVDAGTFGERVGTEGDSSVAFIGRLEYEKGIQLLVALARILDKTDIHVAGKGSLERFLRGIQLPNVIYHGFITEDKKLGLLRKATVMVVPSIWCEMYGYTVLEAFTLGKPVVAFDLGGPKELVEASGGGLLAKPFDIRDFAEKVRYLVENPSEAKKMGYDGRKWAERNVHPRYCAKKLAKAYEVAMASSHH